NQCYLESGLSADACVSGPRLHSDAARHLRLPPRDILGSTALRCVWTDLLSDCAVLQPHSLSPHRGDRPCDLRHCAGNVCSAPEPEFSEQTLLAQSSTFWRMDLRPLCEP